MANFFRKGVSKARWFPAMAGAQPTRAELNAGFNLGGQLTARSGFTFDGSRIPVPVLDNRLDKQIGGTDTIADSSLTFQDDDTVHTVRAGLAKGTKGFVYFMPYGDVATRRGEVWPAESMGVNDSWDISGNTPAQYVVNLAITDVPKLDAVIPA